MSQTSNNDSTGVAKNRVDAEMTSQNLPFEVFYIVPYESHDQNTISQYKCCYRVIHANHRDEAICGYLFTNLGRHICSTGSGDVRGQIFAGGSRIEVYIDREVVGKLSPAPRSRAVHARKVPRIKIYHNKQTGATKPERESAPMLHIRGGCLRLFTKKKRLEDDDTVPAVLWWVAGGVRQRPTGKQLRDWQARSKGDWGEGQRGFIQECIFVMSRGKYCLDQRRNKTAEPVVEERDPPTDHLTESSDMRSLSEL